MENKLLPCPFCGGEARLIDDDWSYVICTKCGINPYHRISIKDAIEAWNNRWMVPCEEGETEGNWHTGTPTEGGLFLVYLKDGTYDIYKFGKEYTAWDIGFSDILAWMPITPYEGEEVNG